MPLADPKKNLLIGMLPSLAYGRIEPHLQPVSWRAGELLLKSEAALDTVYFPIDAIVSLDHFVGDPTSVTDPMPSVALIGNEALVGTELFLGGQTAISHATVRVGGSALRVPADALRAEFSRGTALQRVLLGATDALLAQISNNSACERVHSPVQRLIRWLLLVDDRAARRHMMLTQETLAQFLGVRRETVSVAAGRLQSDGLITYSRGHLMIVDRAGLEARSCTCYRSIKARYDALLRPVE